MPERKYTYKVEIDAAQAKAQATALRQQLLDMLGELAPNKGGAGGGLADAIQEAQKPAQELKRQLEQVSKIDLTKGTDELLVQLDNVQRELRRTRDEYERLGMTAAAKSGPSARSRANQQTYVEEVRKAAGDDAAASARRMGRAINIGQAGAEFKTDESALYQEAERDALRANQANTEKRRFNAAEKRELAELESQLLASELDAIRLQREVAQRQANESQQRADAIYEQLAAGTDELGPHNVGALQEAERLAAETKELAAQEQQMLEGLANANQRLSALIEQQDADMKRAAAKAQGAIVQAGPATAHTQQTAITVTQASAASAERLAVALNEAAAATERMERSRMSTNVRGFELDLERERARIQKDSRLATVMEEQKLRDAQRTARAQENEQKKLTAATEREARKRASAEARAARQAEQEAKRAARAQEAEQRKLTAATEREARRRAQAETRARVGTVGTRFSIGGAWNQLDMMASMAAGGLAAFGVAQVGQQIYGAGASGAQSIRQQATFKEFAARMGQDANAIIAAVKRASNETITEFDAMGLASQVLASRFAQGSTDIAGDLETVTTMARRFSQIFVDESGAAMSTQEIFSRLIKFAREGNKELVDQLGIDNKRIAEVMNTTVDGLASAGGATIRWQGLVKVLGEDLERLGPAATTVADRYEQSASRMLDAQQRIQQALAEPMAAIGEGIANVAQGGVMLTGNSPLDKLRSMVNTDSATGGMGALNARAYKEATDALDAYDAAMAKNASTATMYAGNLRTLVNTLVNQGTLTDEGVAQLDQMATALRLVADGNDAYTTTMRIANMEQIKASSQLLEFAVKMAELEQLYISGAISQQAYTSQLYQMAIGMGAVKTEIANTLPALREFAALAYAGRGGTGGGPAERQGFEWMTPEALGLDAEDVAWLDRLSAGYTARAEGIATRKAAAEANEPYTAAGQDKLRLQLVMDLQKQAAEDERQAAKEAQREWESAAKKTAAEFEKAAEDAAAAFEDALRKVPGLLGTSSVTDEQMAGAKAGVPQNFADNYLRRLADEVAGNKDWEGIDIQDAARRAGVDGSLPKDIILQQVRAAWEDSSLFSGGRNMDLITDFGGLDAIKANLARQDASASGQQSLIDYMTSIGLGPAAPTKEGETGAAGVTSPEQAPQAAADTLAAIQQAFAAENVAKSLSAVGENTLAMIHAGYRTGAMKADWTGPIVDAVVSQLAGQLAGMLDGEGEAPPP